MCSASPCQQPISDPICVVVLLLCRLQACRHYIDGRGSRVCVRAGLDERGDGILGAGGVRWQRLRFGEWCPPGARAVGVRILFLPLPLLPDAQAFVLGEWRGAR